MTFSRKEMPFSHLKGPVDTFGGTGGCNFTNSNRCKGTDGGVKVGETGGNAAAAIYYYPPCYYYFAFASDGRVVIVILTGGKPEGRFGLEV